LPVFEQVNAKLLATVGRKSTFHVVVVVVVVAAAAAAAVRSSSS
jgi:hypothetical protein